MNITTIAIPEGSGRVTERSGLWDQLIDAYRVGVAVSISELDYPEAKRIINAMSHRVRKYMAAGKLRTRWCRKEGHLTLWIE